MRKQINILLVVTLMMGVLMGCGGRKITSNGLSYIKLGEPMPTTGTYKYKRWEVEDTFFVDGDYEWRGSILKYDDGQVYLEEDWFSPDTLNRIRITTPELKVKKDLAVGSTVSQLREANQSWYISHLKDYGVFDFYTRAMPNIHFLVSDPESQYAEETEWEKIKIDGFSPDAKVVAIVVH